MDYPSNRKKSRKEVGATAHKNDKQQIRNKRNHFRFGHLRTVVDAKPVFGVDGGGKLKAAF